MRRYIAFVLFLCFINLGLTPIKKDSSKTVLLGAFISNADGKTRVTNLTNARVTIKIRKNGGAPTTLSSNGLENDCDGYYKYTIPATATDTVGILYLDADNSGCLPFFQNYEIVTEYDNTDLGTIKTNVNTANSTLSTVNSNVSTINTNVNTANSSLSTITTNLNTANTNINTANSSIGTITTNLSTANSNISSIISTQSSHTTALSTANNSLSTVQATQAGHTAILNQLRSTQLVDSLVDNDTLSAVNNILGGTDYTSILNQIRATQLNDYAKDNDTNTKAGAIITTQSSHTTLLDNLFKLIKLIRK